MDRRDFIKNAAVTGAAAVGITQYASPLKAALFGEPADCSAAPLRPPGALAEREFLARCIRCMRCRDACPNDAIISLDDALGRANTATPAIKPRRQACMLCNRIDGDHLKCGQACPTGALRKVGNTPDQIRQAVHMGTAQIDTVLCYSYNNWSCGACYRACPLPGQAMSLGLWERPTVNADACLGCGLCERACIRYPQAIRVKANRERPA